MAARLEWTQCTTTSNERLGGCRSMVEHDRYRHQALLDELESLRPLQVLHDDMVRLKREAEAERDAALADNTALLGVMNVVGKSDGTWGTQTCTWCGCRVHAERCPVGRALSQPHPGAALLEEHRKEIDGWKALVQKAEKAIAALHEEHAKALEARDDANAGLLATLKREREERAKALVRARNEGLEKVAKKLERLGTGPLITSATLLAKNVRAMKEPES